MSNQPTNIHDAFFKQVLSDPSLAAPFLREHLPPEVADLLGPEPPEPIPGSFVDEELREHHSDLLFRMQLKTSHNAYAYILMEHKSSLDAGARLQLLRYVVRILIQYIPSFRHALVDLAPMDDRTLSVETRLRAFLKALKYSRHPRETIRGSTRPHPAQHLFRRRGTHRSLGRARVRCPQPAIRLRLELTPTGSPRWNSATRVRVPRTGRSPIHKRRTQHSTRTQSKGANQRCQITKGATCSTRYFAA